MFGAGLMPVDRDSMRYIAAFHLIREMEGQELDKVSLDDKECEKKRMAIRKKYKARELDLLRNASGHLLQIVEGK